MRARVINPSRNCHKKTHHWLRRMAAGHMSLLIYLSLASFSSFHHSFISFLHALLTLPPFNSHPPFFPPRAQVGMQWRGKPPKTQFIHLLMCEIEFLPSFNRLSHQNDINLGGCSMHSCYHVDIRINKKSIVCLFMFFCYFLTLQ